MEDIEQDELIICDEKDAKCAATKKKAADLKILFEDNHILVVIKPQNIPTQGDSSGDDDMLNLVKTYLKEKHNKPGNAFVGLVHRLDRPTGGVMVFAKTSKAAERLCAQIREGDFRKKYLAVVIGEPAEHRLRLSNYLIKDEAKNVVRVVLSNSKAEGARLAELDYNVLEVGDKISLVDINLLTGRSHQARVQMANIGTPIFGDVKYGGDSLAKGHNLALWAYQLDFIHPISKNNMVFKVFPPQDKIPWKYFNIEKFINVVRPE